METAEWNKSTRARTGQGPCSTHGSREARPAVEVFYDGDCPLCAREIRFLRRLDRGNRVGFTDISDPKFQPPPELTWDQLMARIHGRLADGKIIEGVEVFRRLYAAVGFGALVAVTRLPGIAFLLEWAYSGFAASRLRLTGRCDLDRCRTRRALQEHPGR